MRWQGRRQSSNVDDRRGMGGRIAVGGGIGTIILAIIGFLMGGNPLDSLNLNTQPDTQAQRELTQEEKSQGEFAKVVLGNTEDVWNDIFQKKFGKDYPEPRMVLFEGNTDAACGYATSATGPFYCPADQDIYIDLSFFNELESRFQAKGDFAQAYVIAHEVGHHVQRTLGITDKVDAQRGRLSETEMNALSVRLELQADFLAGVWAHHAHEMENLLEAGDIEEALNAASAIGDDRLQMQSQGRVVPDAFTHGTSEQRMHWFKKGFETGDIDQGDTFNAPL